METDLNFIMKLNEEEITIETLKKIKQRINKLKNSNHVKSIKENKTIPINGVYYPGRKEIEVNLTHIIKYLDIFEEAMWTDIPNARKDEMKMLKLLTAYRIFLHEIYHSKQIYNAYETDSNDLESEIIRAIYNMSRKTYLQELETKSREQIMEEKTKETNDILMPHFEINPIERKAEIESFKRVRQILMPVRDNYISTYDELYVLEQATLIKGYDQAEVPFIQLIKILKEQNPNFRIMFPYGCSNKYDFFKTVEGLATEQERIELGLNIYPKTKDRVYEKIDAILFK